MKSSVVSTIRAIETMTDASFLLLGDKTWSGNCGLEGCCYAGGGLRGDAPPRSVKEMRGEETSDTAVNLGVGGWKEYD